MPTCPPLSTDFSSETDMDLNTLIPKALGASPLTDHEHDAFLALDRGLYASVLRVPGVAPATVMGIVTRLLANPPHSTDHREDELIVAALGLQHPEDVLLGFGALVDRKVNNARTSRTVRTWLWGCPALEDLAVGHRAKLRRLLTHVMGDGVVKTCVRYVDEKLRDAHQDAYLRRELFRFGEPKTIEEVFRFVFGELRSTPRLAKLAAYEAAKSTFTAGEGLPLTTLLGLRGTYHPRVRRHVVHQLAGDRKLKRDVEKESDGELVRLAKAYLSNPTNEAVDRLRASLATRTTDLPKWGKHIAVIVDASDSMRGVGHRENNNLAIAIIVAELLRTGAERADLLWVGGDGSPWPQASGPTALASVLLDAAEKKVDAVVVITDGWEDCDQGDAAHVVRALRQLGWDTPIVQVLPAFTPREFLTGRQPFGDAPCVLETGQGELLPLWLRIRASAEPHEAATLFDALEV